MLPVVINNFNRLSSTKKLVEQLQNLGYRQLHIIDNGSTYPPLLDWYSHLKYVTLHRYHNIGPRAIYDTGLISSFEGWVAYSDSDLELDDLSPAGFIEDMLEKTLSMGHIKGGLSLRIDDITEQQYGAQWKEWEKKYWQNQIAPGIYEAELDTTFCLVKKDIPFQYKALRFGSYPARHIPWYLPKDLKDISEEEQYFIQHSSSDSILKRVYQTLYA